MKNNIQYKMEVDSVPVTVNIHHKPGEFVPIYDVSFPKLEEATQAALDSIREKMIEELIIEPSEIVDPREYKELRERFTKKAMEMIEEELPTLSVKERKIILGTLLHQALGLGDIEIVLNDENLEEIVINSAKEPIWVYHIKLGWLKTNINLESETQIYNYASAIGRRVGMQITNLNPLMDAYLATGDRTNATLFPISSFGNTITIRKFARRPWTITDFIELKTISSEAAAFLWLAIQYELNILIAGGTASGKTSLLNSLTTFIPPNHRILSIEDTREIQLPRFLHWIPLTTRPPNPEGKGEVTMLHLMINALRMRPDRVIVGEMRRTKEAEVLFEAIHTGHSVYSTVHANTAEETYRRLVNPPIGIPPSMLCGLQLIAVMHRDRRKNIRRVLQISELSPSGDLKDTKIELNTLFRWIASKDEIMKFSKSYKAMNDIKLYTGMSDNDIKKDLEDKQFILNWLVEKQIKDLNEVGRIISEYYINPKHTLKRIKSGDMEIKKDAVKPPMKPLPKPPIPPYKRKLETEH
ncbi:MAG: Flp pilus assembly complex ATPase component TadA [Nanoarchaeota archaeon]|nr:Flp pilus assembly complex ATPase component TadA [Nanoarchaeota archaeon]MBU2519661.1 Flp pilus assembly complex ATPase component TadA [Nanoarchaeota archaeon]